MFCKSQDEVVGPYVATKMPQQVQIFETIFRETGADAQYIADPTRPLFCDYLLWEVRTYLASFFFLFASYLLLYVSIVFMCLNADVLFLILSGTHADAGCEPALGCQLSERGTAAQGVL